MIVNMFMLFTVQEGAVPLDGFAIPETGHVAHEYRWARPLEILVTPNYKLHEVTPGSYRIAIVIAIKAVRTNFNGPELKLTSFLCP